jgi:hypothetical protein
MADLLRLSSYRKGITTMGRWNWLRGIALAGILAAAGSGCAHAPGGISDSTTPIEGRRYLKLGHAKGTDSRVLLFGVLPVSGSNSTREAIADAIRSRGGDAMIEVTVESYTIYLILFSKMTTVVEGEVIRFQD